MWGIEVIFKGKNLILICAEAFSGFIIDPELTPALYRLTTKGINFNDYYDIRLKEARCKAFGLDVLRTNVLEEGIEHAEYLVEITVTVGHQCSEHIEYKESLRLIRVVDELIPGIHCHHDGAIIG